MLSQNRLQSCARYLTSADSVLTRYSSGFAKEWAFEDIRRSMPENKARAVDLFLIHTENHYNFDLATLPAPFPDWQYRVYTDKMGKEHKDHGVDPSIGAMALVRPDGYIGMVTGLDGGSAITKFMDKFMIASESVWQSEKMIKNGNGITNGTGMTNENDTTNGNGTQSERDTIRGNGVTNGHGQVN